MSARINAPAPKVEVSEHARSSSPSKVSGKAASDPRFQRMLGQLEREAEKARRHPSAAKKVEQAHAAAQSPPGERAAGAKAGQVEAMEAAKPRPVKTEGFEAALLAEIERAMPRSQAEAEALAEGRKDLSGLGEGVSDQARAAATEAAGPVQRAALQAPAVGAVPGREATPLTVDNAPPMSLDVQPATPRPLPDATLSASHLQADARRRKTEAGLGDAQIAAANDARFTAVAAEERRLADSVTTTPARVRARERAALDAASRGATAESQTALDGLRAAHAEGGRQVQTRQQQVRRRDEARRREVVDRIEAIYTRTRDRVEERLGAMERDVSAAFERRAAAALDAMVARARSRIQGRSLWSKVKNLFGLDPQVKRVLDEERATLSTTLRRVARDVAGIVDQRLAEVRAEIAAGRAELDATLTGLPRDLRRFGKEAAEGVAARFEALEATVEQRKHALARGLARRYAEAITRVESALGELRQENEGLLSGVAAAVASARKVLADLKPKLMTALRQAADQVLRILADPVSFLRGLVAAVKGGFERFVENFPKWLAQGLAAWLMGALAEAGVQAPRDLSPLSLFRLALDVLGLSWTALRPKAVRLVGEPAVKGLETLGEFAALFVRGDVAGLWGLVKDRLSDLKDLVLGALKDWVFVTVVKRAVLKVLSMLNPAGAFVQACMAIYDTLLFVVEKAARIASLVGAVLRSIGAIASRAIGAAIGLIEAALGRTVPLVIGFLAQLIGLEGVPRRVLELLRRAKARVEGAVEAAMRKAIGALKGLVGRMRGGYANKIDVTESSDGEKAQRKQAALEEAMSATDLQAFSPDWVRGKLPGLQRKHRLSSLSLVIDHQQGDLLVFHFEASASKKVKSRSATGKVRGESHSNLGPVEIPRERMRWRVSTKRALAKEYATRTQRTGDVRMGSGRILRKSLARRHIISFADVRDHYLKAFNVDGLKVGEAWKMLAAKQRELSGSDNRFLSAPPPTAAKARTAIVKLTRLAFNDPTNIRIGPAAVNSALGRLVDIEMLVLDDNKVRRDIEKAIDNHAREFIGRWGIPGKEFKLNQQMGEFEWEVTWELVD